MMTDKIDALERLVRLHADGHMTDDEFLTEKAKLLGDAPAADSDSQATTSSSRPRPWIWVIAIALLAAIGLAAWALQSGSATPADANGGSEATEMVAGGDGWVFAETTDPMTDETVSSASKNIEADGFVIEAEIACRTPSGAVHYTFNAYDRDRNPAEATSAYYNANLGTYHSALVRIDDGEAHPMRAFNPGYSNQFHFDQSPETRNMEGILGNSRDEFAKGRRLTIKLDLKQGTPLIQIDQTEASISRVLSACAGAIQDDVAAVAREAARPPKVFEFVIRTDDPKMKIEDAGERDPGEAQLICVGDSIAIKNLSPGSVSLIRWTFGQDGTEELGILAAGGSRQVAANFEGTFLIESYEGVATQYHYKVQKCGQNGRP